MYSISRRQFLLQSGAAAGVALLSDSASALPGRTLPTSPVAIGACDSYQPDAVLASLSGILNQIGGLKKLVAGKTVAIKVNLVNTPSRWAAGLPANRTYQVHPSAAYALAVLLDKAGARRLRFLESTFSTDPIESFFVSGGWDLHKFQSLSAKVEFEETRNLGQGRSYVRRSAGKGAGIFAAYDLNHAYTDCDVYISVAKMKNHRIAGVTLTLKNNFGITPTALYGSAEHDESFIGGRGEMLHWGDYSPPGGAPAELNPHSPRSAVYRVPRIIADLAVARPIDLAILDGVETISGGEGPWQFNLARRQPHLLLAGLNPVCTDAIAATCMGYDPTAADGTNVFPGTNHIAEAAKRGIGTNNPKEIEVLGIPLARAVHPYGWLPYRRGDDPR